MLHPFDRPLEPAILLRRYKRFLADVELPDGSELTVHCPNPGRMTACIEPGCEVRISDSGNPKRKLRYTLELTRMGETWVGVNTARPNAAVEDFVRSGAFPELDDYGEIRREVKYGVEQRSRIDLLLSEPGRPDCYVEIKNATLRTATQKTATQKTAWAAFPDAVTARGRKQLEELEHVVSLGHRAVIFFFVGRDDCEKFRPADEVDPAYGKAFRHALDHGVEAIAWRMRWNEQGVETVGRLYIDL